jgi:hypothetical protein
MSHFSEQAWADFVRGVDTSGAKSELQAHIASACAECKSTFDLWGRVVRLTAKENEYAPPDNLVRLVKLALPTAEATDPQSWTIASLLFDSASAPLPAGIRGGAASTRQFVYEGQGLTVDVRFERRQHSNMVWASGQVLDKHVPLRWLGKAAVVLRNDRGQVLTKTEAGKYGEFQFEFEPEDHLRISIATADHRTLHITLGNLD